MIPETVRPSVPIASFTQPAKSEIPSPVPRFLGSGLQTSLPSVSLFTDSTICTANTNSGAQSQPQFRMAVVDLTAQLQPHTLGFSGNTGYFSPVIAPLYQPPQTYNPITG